MSDTFSFVFALLCVAFLHELGHIFAALKTGIPVQEAGLGLPFFSRQIANVGGVRISISPVLLGAYVLPDRKKLRESSRIARLVFFSGGVFMNIVSALLVVAAFTLYYGTPDYSRVVVQDVFSGSPAEGILEPGDILVLVNQNEISKEKTIKDILKSSDGAVDFLIYRNGEALNVQVQPDEDRKTGIRYQYARNHGILPALSYTLNFYQESVSFFISSLEDFISGKNDSEETLTVDFISGVAFGNFVAFFAAFSIGLAFLNLLPIPSLDGGHILFEIIETVYPLPYQLKSVLTVIGFAVVLMISFLSLLSMFIHRPG